jgi:hypothetical protein
VADESVEVEPFMTSRNGMLEVVTVVSTEPTTRQKERDKSSVGFVPLG